MYVVFREVKCIERDGEPEAVGSESSSEVFILDSGEVGSEQLLYVLHVLGISGEVVVINLYHF